MTAKNGLPCVRCGAREWNSQGSCSRCALENKRRWNDANRDKKRENDRNWAKANQDKLREKDRKRDRSGRNREPFRKNTQRWKRLNPEKANLYERIRYARKRSNSGNYTPDEWLALCKKYDSRCLACGRADVKLTVDHVVPLSLGGSNDIANIQPLCNNCNAAKNNKHIDYRQH